MEDEEVQSQGSAESASLPVQKKRHYIATELKQKLDTWLAEQDNMQEDMKEKEDQHHREVMEEFQKLQELQREAIEENRQEQERNCQLIREGLTELIQVMRELVAKMVSLAVHS